MEISGRTAIVTGAGRRLGAAIALALAERGCNLMVHHHASSEDASEVVKHAQRRGVRAQAAQADLTRSEGVDSLFEAFDKEFERLDILVNSAAVMHAVDLLQATEADWQGTMALNLKGTFFCLQQAARRMQGHGGAIINLSDIAGRKPWTRFPIHSISKAGVEMLTRVAALRLAPSIRVNAVAPGPVLKPESMTQARWEEIGRGLPLQRPGSPQDAVAAVLFLLESDFITGATLVVDGGDLIV